jgi:hypothetical protein
MPDESNPNEAEVAYTQLTQVRVPLEEAGEAFSTRDASGRIPIVLIPKQLNRVRNEPVIAGVVVLLGAILVQLLANQPIVIPIGIVLAILMILMGVYRSFIVRVPEGANALLAKGGRYTKTIGSGTHIIQPVIVVTHLVTRREIPFDVPVVEAPTKDNVRASVDTLVTLTSSIHSSLFSASLPTISIRFFRRRARTGCGIWYARSAPSRWLISPNRTWRDSAMNWQKGWKLTACRFPKSP